ANGNVGNFSSYGPSSDGRIKPDVASIGVAAVLEASNGTVGAGNGTSFATPNMAGLATCLWQGFPEFSNMTIRNALQLSGNIASSPDARTGYGIPDMRKAFTSLLIDFSTASASTSNCKASISWTSKDVSSMKYELERKIAGESSYSKIADIASTTNVSFLTNH